MGTPVRWAVYRCFTAEGHLLYVGVSGNVWRRLADHEEKAWYQEVTGITLRWHDNEAEAMAAERLAIQIERPKYNVLNKTTNQRSVRKSEARRRKRQIPVARLDARRSLAAGPGTPSRDRMLELLGIAGRDGATPLGLCQFLEAEGLGVNRATVQRWLRAEVNAGCVAQIAYARYVSTAIIGVSPLSPEVSVELSSASS